MELELQDKVVIVTGASGGIGDAICKAFLKEGSQVIALYRGDKKKLAPLETYVHETAGMMGSLFPFEMNVESADSIKNGVVEILKLFPNIDVLVNCMGFSIERPFLLTDDHEWDEVIDVNLTATVRLTRHILKPMFKARRGSVINISSVLGERYGRGTVAYAVAKAGINRFTQALAMEVGPKQIRVNAIAPGLIDTPMSSSLSSRFGQQLNELTPLSRIGQPHEVAFAALFLASEKTSSYITGTTLYVDGGISI